MGNKIIYTCKGTAASPAIFPLLAPYRCKVRFYSDEWGIFGRGSLDIAKGVNLFHDTDTSQPAIVVGDFCEMAAGCQILLGGEHYNARVFNNALAHFPLVKHYCKKADHPYLATFSRGPIKIGHNVVISQRVLIRSGVTIGNGAVIGADACVLRDISDFTIAVGSPASMLRKRFDEDTVAALQSLRWWDWELDFLLEHFPGLYALTSSDMLEYARNLIIRYDQNLENYVVVSAIRDGALTHYQCEGVERGGVFIPLAELPEQAYLYLQQTKAATGSDVTVMHHLFSLFD